MNDQARQEQRGGILMRVTPDGNEKYLFDLLINVS